MVQVQEEPKVVSHVTTEAERRMAAGDRRERWGWFLMGKESEIFFASDCFSLQSTACWGETISVYTTLWANSDSAEECLV